MYRILILLLFSQYFVTNSSATFVKTLYGNDDPSIRTKQSFTIDADLNNDAPTDANHREKRATEQSTNGIKPKVNHLNDTHKQLMVHWVGEKSKVVICLARDPTPIIPAFAKMNPSAVYISYDDGDTYANKTDSFKLGNGSYATLEKFYNHPKYNTHFVFTDIWHNMIYLTKDCGKTFRNRSLSFTPSDVSFHEFQPSTFVVLDKNDTDHKFYVTEDFGETFRLTHHFVKSFYWMKDVHDNQQLMIQRYEPNGLSTIIYSKNLFRNRASQIYATDVKDFFFKGDYLFTTKVNSKGDLELYVSYKLGKQVLCVFNSIEKFNSYYIVDVTGSRAMVAASHSDVSSNLYVSENLGGNEGQVRFILSLENVFAYFPNTTWQDTWLHHISEDAFADVYKVEGLSGIYIASKVISKPASNIGPQELASVITFNHGASWRPIEPPAYDVEGQSTGCIVHKNCSLHLSQKFSQLYPDTRTISILSSKSAPGVILATGVLGGNLRGHHSVYISLDAGLTWRQTLRELFFFNMGDHGGILSAVKYYRSKGETRHILYSIDEGKTWNKTVFHNEEMRLYGLMTEPGENSTVFTMFGSLPEAHQWIIVKVDFEKVFNRTCADEDYKMWSPSQSGENRSYIPCVLGQQTTYQRRMPNVPCLNGLDYVRITSKQVCDCDNLDYECDFGFVQVGNPPNAHCIFDKTMIPYDPYKVPASCKPGQFYNRTKGYRKISGDKCVGGFEAHYLPDQVPCPFQEINEFILFAQKERISRYNLVTKNLEELPVKNLKNVIATDFDMSTNCVYWADIAWDTIGRQCFTNGSKVEILVSTDLASIEGMAFDWISKTLYFVDGMRAKIELIRTDINHSGRMRRTILDSKVLNKPRGIAVHPQSGYMFWTDWSAENPSVNRANLDGSNNKTLFARDKVEWPNGITIDYIANRIYWVDARRDYIGSADLHGDDFMKIVSEVEVVSHPFAIAVFKNNMYWDDWKRNSIFVADKDVYKGVDVIVKQLPGLMDLKVYAHGLQIGTNACSNSTCPYICVGMPKDKFACLCPDGLIPKDDKCLCPGDVQPLANMTCPSVGKSCSTEHFTCGNSLCIPKGWKCDGEDDCGDNSDEEHCGSETCPPTFFVCGDGKCLPHYWTCDYDVDCSDGLDEANCPKENCTEGQFACQDGRCISSKWRCDGENDCRDNSDERNCNNNQPSSCKSDEFHCPIGDVRCIPSTWKCDGEPDCYEGFDEHNCNNNTCSEIQFSCGPPSNRCIYNTWVCDGDNDCQNGRDEANCTVLTPEVPRPSNNFGSKNGTCQDWMFRCQNSRCIPFWWKCDGANDCGDGSDELGCSTTPPVATTTPTPSSPNLCGNNQFQCATGECIFSSWVCDGMADCHGGEDEQHCNGNKNCNSSQFRCRMDGSCVPLSALCDDIFDCPDGTDELICKYNGSSIPATPSCSSGLFPCDGNSCYPLSYLCNGKKDCLDGYDEANCSADSKVYQVMGVTAEDSTTTNTSIVVYWWMGLHTGLSVEFLPSISKVGDNKWINGTWTDKYLYTFNKLQPFTRYNVTVYVRNRDTSKVFAPIVYTTISTSEGIPSEPWNVSVSQKNGSHVLIHWNPPLQPNGIITRYDIIWKEVNSSEIPLKLTSNETSHMFYSDFLHDVTYTFWVVAYNSRYQSGRSHPVSLVYDRETVVGNIEELTVQNVTDHSVALTWRYEGDADGFNITILTFYPYPTLPPRTTKTKNITLQLAPGADYKFEVYAYKKNFVGPTATISASTTGIPLPRISNVHAVLNGTDRVVVTWDKPKYVVEMDWLYGVYSSYDIQVYHKPIVVTKLQSATIQNLVPCEEYHFEVGLIGPIGYGPHGFDLDYVKIPISNKAPAKDVRVRPEDGNPLRMFVEWNVPCTYTEVKSYVVQIREQSTSQTWHVRVNELSFTFNVSYGGVYDVSVSSDLTDAIYSKPVTYHTPPIPAPFEVQVVSDTNGSYIVYWQEQHLPTSAGNYYYEVLVQQGPVLNESTAERFTVEKPPFVFTGAASNIYTFAVRIKTPKGLKSVTSEWVSRRGEEAVVQQSSSGNLTAIIVPSLLVLIALSAIIAFLVVRNRRLQSSFTRFANSHYDTRSEAATFDDSSLEEEESPQIRGFSDDEPLVIA